MTTTTPPPPTTPTTPRPPRRLRRSAGERDELRRVRVHHQVARAARAERHPLRRPDQAVAPAAPRGDDDDDALPREDHHLSLSLHLSARHTTREGHHHLSLSPSLRATPRARATTSLSPSLSLRATPHARPRDATRLIGSFIVVVVVHIVVLVVVVVVVTRARVRSLGRAAAHTARRRAGRSTRGSIPSRRWGAARTAYLLTRAARRTIGTSTPEPPEPPFPSSSCGVATRGRLLEVVRQALPDSPRSFPCGSEPCEPCCPAAVSSGIVGTMKHGK